MPARIDFLRMGARLVTKLTCAIVAGTGTGYAAAPADTSFPAIVCGRFGPAEAVRARPGLYWTVRHGSAGVHFMEPWLAGCAPRELRAGSETTGYATQMAWAYDRDGRVTGSHWLSRYGDRSVYTASVLDYDARGLLTAARFNCTRIASAERFELRYDDRGRLQSQRWSHPPGCFGSEVGTERVERYVYSELHLPELPSAIEVEATAPQPRRYAVKLDYTLDDKGRITRLERSTPAGWVETYAYGESGRVERAARMWGTTLRIAEQTFSHDAQGRLKAIAQVVQPASRWEFDYAADGSLSKLVAPTPHYNPSLHPAAVYPFAVLYRHHGRRSKDHDR